MHSSGVQDAVWQAFDGTPTIASVAADGVPSTSTRRVALLLCALVGAAMAIVGGRYVSPLLSGESLVAATTRGTIRSKPTATPEATPYPTPIASPPIALGVSGFGSSAKNPRGDNASSVWKLGELLLDSTRPAALEPTESCDKADGLFALAEAPKWQMKLSRAVNLAPLSTAALSLWRPTGRRLLALMLTLARRLLPVKHCSALVRLVETRGLVPEGFDGIAQACVATGVTDASRPEAQREKWF